MRPRPFRFGFSGVATLAAVATISLCFSDLPVVLAPGLASVFPLDGAPVAGDARAGDGQSRPLRALGGGRQWLNGPPLDAAALRGKVVLVDFWTYSCINSLRPLPYMRAWAARYAARGLVVIGVHSPEFQFETDIANVRRATARLGIGYPVVLDSDFAIWRAFGNDAWPGFYFIGADGRVRHRQLGEGHYAEAEQVIRQLLAEADGKAAAGGPTEVRGTGIEAAPDWANQRSPETYIGYAKAERFSAPGGIRQDVANGYRPAGLLPPDHWDLTGAWRVGGEFAVPQGPGGTIRYRFHARDLHLVLGAPAHGKAARFRVTIDGAPPGADHGTDVDADGRGEVREDRLYQLVRQAGKVGDRLFEIEFLDPGARAYAFTFG